jgi:hypothetical protein
VALLIDATLIRSVLVPASMQLLGDRNWYLPRWLDWIPHFDVEGHAGKRTPAARGHVADNLGLSGDTVMVAQTNNVIRPLWISLVAGAVAGVAIGIAVSVMTGLPLAPEIGLAVGLAAGYGLRLLALAAGLRHNADLPVLQRLWPLIRDQPSRRQAAPRATQAFADRLARAVSSWHSLFGAQDSSKSASVFRVLSRLTVRRTWGREDLRHTLCVMHGESKSGAEGGAWAADGTGRPRHVVEADSTPFRAG